MALAWRLIGTLGLNLDDPTVRAKILDIVYPPGSEYYSELSENPANYMRFGNWIKRPSLGPYAWVRAQGTNINPGEDGSEVRP